MASARRADMAEATDLEPMPAEQPKMVVTHGRGGTGKSTGVRILKERADEAGRPVAIADADRTNATLGSFYADVVRPELRGEQGAARSLSRRASGRRDRWGAPAFRRTRHQLAECP